MMTLIKLPDGKQEYISDLDSTIDLSREYIGSEYTNELREKINDRIIEVEDMYNEEIENLNNEVDYQANILLSIRSDLEKISDNIDKLDMLDVQDIIDDILKMI